MRPEDRDGSRCELELELYVLAELPPGRMAAVREHLEACESCRLELLVWQQIDAGAAELRREVESSATPMSVALPALMAALETPETGGFDLEDDLEAEAAAAAGSRRGARTAPARAAPPTSRRVAGLLVILTLATSAAVLLVIAAYSILGLGGHETLPDQHDPSRAPTVTLTQAPSHITLDGREIVIAQGADLGPRDRWELLLDEDDWLFRLEGIALHVSPGSRLRQGDRGPPPRVELLAGSVEVLAPEAEPLIVHIGELEILVGEGAVVVIDARDTSADGASGLVRVGVWEGRASLGEIGFADAAGAPGSELIDLGAGEAIAVRLEDGAVTPGALAAVEREVASGALPPLDPRLASGDLPPAVPVPADGLEPPVEGTPGQEPGGADEPVVPGDDPTVTETPAPGGLRELPAGTMQVNLGEEVHDIGDVVTLEVTVGAGDVGLGSYRLELEFQPRGSDLVVEVAGDPVGIAGRSPFVSSFDPDSQKLQVIDTTFSSEPLGRGTFTVLSLRVRILAGSAGSHQVGGTVVQILDPSTEPLGTPRLQTRGTIDIR